MRSLIFFALLSVAMAKPRPGGLWGAPGLSYVPQPALVAPQVVHAAPAVIAKPAATSYASFQQIVHPVAQPIVHAAPVISQPIVHAAPVIPQPLVHAAPVVSQPLVQTYAQPIVNSYAHGW